MYGNKDLKPRIEHTATTVECPVKDCSVTLPRMKQNGPNLTSRVEDKMIFLCPEHRIFVSPSTFEYFNETDNLLWKDTADLRLLHDIKTVKRECRMARENSEDAVTWNAVRFLERNGLIGACLESWTKTQVLEPEIIYWSYHQGEKNAWSWLNKARQEFGEALNRGSEPDIIVSSKKALFFIEAKLTATNETTPSDKNNPKRYLTGGEGWFDEVFRDEYQNIAIAKKKYELLRFWLLGTWIAAQLGIDFYLVNLVPARRERSIEADFKPLIGENDRRKFTRANWEDIYRKASSYDMAETKMIMEYFENKTCGYDKDGKLQRVFEV